MNKPPINPALARIQAIKAKAASGFGSSFDEIETFENPLIRQAAEEIAQERRIIIAAEAAIPKNIPRLDGETEQAYEARKKEIEAGRVRFEESEEERNHRMLEIRAADQLLAQQLSGIAVAPTRTAGYNNLGGTVDNMIVVLESMKKKE